MGKGKGPAEENGRMQVIFLGVTCFLALLGLILGNALIVFNMDEELFHKCGDSGYTQDCPNRRRELLSASPAAHSSFLDYGGFKTAITMLAQEQAPAQTNTFANVFDSFAAEVRSKYERPTNKDNDKAARPDFVTHKTGQRLRPLKQRLLADAMPCPRNTYDPTADYDSSGYDSSGSDYSQPPQYCKCSVPDGHQLCCGLNQHDMCNTGWYADPNNDIQQAMALLRNVASGVAAVIIVGSLPALMGAVAKWKRHETCSKVCGCFGVLTIWAFGVVASLGVLAYLAVLAGYLHVLCEEYKTWGEEARLGEALETCHDDCAEAVQEPGRAFCAIPRGMMATTVTLALGSVMAFVSSIIVCIGFCKHKTPKVDPGQQGQELQTVQAVAVVPGK